VNDCRRIGEQIFITARVSLFLRKVERIIPVSTSVVVSASSYKIMTIKMKTKNNNAI